MESDKSVDDTENNEQDAIFGHLYTWLSWVNDDPEDCKLLRKICSPIVLLILFLIIGSLLIYFTKNTCFGCYIFPITFIIFYILCFLKGKRKWLCCALPFIGVLTGAALFCLFNRWLNGGSLPTWHPKYDTHIVALVSSHFNVMALLAAFVASVGLWFKGDLWKIKGKSIKEELKNFVLKGGYRHNQIRESKDDNIRKYQEIDAPDNCFVTSEPALLEQQLSSVEAESLTGDESLKKVIQNLSKLIVEGDETLKKKILEAKEKEETLEEVRKKKEKEEIDDSLAHLRKACPTAKLTNDKAFRIFIDRTIQEYDSIEKLIKSVNTLFIWNGLVIAVLCVTSTIFAYQAIFTENIRAYHISYVLGFCAVLNTLFQIIIVFYPQFLLWKIQRAMKKENVTRRYKVHMGKNMNLSLDAENLSSSDY